MKSPKHVYPAGADGRANVISCVPPDPPSFHIDDQPVGSAI